jgi:hypothetical protein
MVVDELLRARNELLAQSSRPPAAVLLLSPTAYAELERAMPADWRTRLCPREFCGLPILVTRHLPTGTDFVLMQDPEGRPFELHGVTPSEAELHRRGVLAELEQAGPRPIFDELGPVTKPVKAKSFDDWLTSTAKLLGESSRQRR